MENFRNHNKNTYLTTLLNKLYLLEKEVLHLKSLYEEQERYIIILERFIKEFVDEEVLEYIQGVK